MPLDFPPSPSLNEIYTFGGRSWKWNGTSWDSYNPDAENVVDSLNGITGAVVLAAGTNITLGTSGNTITINSSGGGGGGTYVNTITGTTNQISVSGNTGDVTVSLAQNITTEGTLTVKGEAAGRSLLIGDGRYRPSNIVFNQGYTAETPIYDAGLIINRGLSPEVKFYWDETADSWRFTNDGTNYYNLFINSGNLAIKNSDNNFSASQTISTSAATFSVYDSDILTYFRIEPTDRQIGYLDENSTGIQYLKFADLSADSNFYTISLPNSSGTVALTSGIVSSIRGLTGAVGLTNGSGIGLSVSGKTLTVSNTGVLSFNGLVGDVTGVTTGSANTFVALQTFSNGAVISGATLNGTINITGLSTPTTDLDAANKFYVDTVASVGVHYHQSVYLASTDSETFSSGVTYNNGTSGVGAFLRKTSSFARINIDGTNGSTGDRILIRSATTGQWNGVYDVTNQGDGTTGWILTRSSDADNYHPYANDGLGGNDYFFVTNGSSLKGNAYICSNSNGITFGTTAITFALFSTPPVYTAGTGLALNSLQFSNTGVLSFNGLTGAVTGVTTGSENTFVALQSFNAGISAAGATFSSLARFNSGISSAGGTFSALTRFTAGISAAGGMTLAGVLNGATAIFSNRVSVPELYAGSIFPYGKSYIDINRQGNSRVYIGDVEGFGQGTYISLEDNSSAINLVSSNGSINMGDVGGIYYSNVFTVDTTADTAQTAFQFAAAGYVPLVISSQLVTTTNAKISGSLEAIAGISSAGGTFSALTRFTAGISAAGATLSSNTTIPSGATLNIGGTLLINQTQGSNNQVLTSTGSGITWATPAAAAAPVTSVEGFTGDVVLPAVDLMFFNMGIV